MGVSYTVFNEILNGKRPVTTEYALLLEAALGTNASIWIGLQADYNMQKAKQDKSFMKRLEKIRKIIRRKSTPKDKPILIKQTFNIDGQSTPCNVKALQIWTKGANDVPVLSAVYGHIDISKQG